MSDLEKLMMVELQKLAKEKGFRGIMRMRKPELIDLLEWNKNFTPSSLHMKNISELRAIADGRG